MKSTKYRIHIGRNGVSFETTRAAAEKRAREYAKDYPNKSVFISKFRVDQGMTLYLNRDGWSNTGEAW